MDVPGFSGDDERRRFYGEDYRPPPSEELEFGTDWRSLADPAAVYTLRWAKDTKVIYVLRRPAPPRRTVASSWTEEDVADPDEDDVVDAYIEDSDEEFDDTDQFDDAGDLDAAVPPPAAEPSVVTHMDFGMHVLGWAENVGALEAALLGWQEAMHRDDGLEWVRQRLTEAAAETDRRRGRSPSRRWPGFPRER